MTLVLGHGDSSLLCYPITTEKKFPRVKVGFSRHDQRKTHIMKHLIWSLFIITSICPGFASAAERPPNVVVLFADDLGYGDLGCFGNPTIRTPELDRMAVEGMKLTQFYSAAPVCTPSRAALMTGRLPIRSGLCHDRRRVLFPNSDGGIPAREITIAEALKTAGYATACIGKWHLGHLPQYLPTNNGFDYYFGIPYSNDMHVVRRGDPPLPLMLNTKIVEQPAFQPTLTKRYTASAIQFIEQHKAEPFFVYLAYTFPHIPLFASDDFLGKSPRGLYGDVVEELDWSVGRILQTLRDHNLAENTLVIFTSDNGPWLIKDLEGGTAGLLRDGKGSTWEGGMREPTVAWWPSKIKAGTVSQGLGSTMDIFTTCLKMAGVAIPEDRIIDGVDLRPVLFQSGPSLRKTVFYYRGTQLMAVRKGPWKAHLITRPAYGRGEPVTHDPPVLYQLDHDPSERFDVSKVHPEIIADIMQTVQEHREKMVAAPTQLEALIESH